MGDRKVQNFHFPVDFDPTKLAKRNRVDRAPVNGMLPFSLQCNSCGTFTRRGKKFNGRKEDSLERYLGIKIWRIFMKCPNCKNEITFKTDPQNSNYTLERGATRNFEARLVRTHALEALRQQRVADDASDTMKALENKAIESKRELEDLEELQRLQERGAAVADRDPLELAVARREDAEAALAEALAREEEQDAAEARRVFGGDGRWDSAALDTALECGDADGYGSDFSDGDDDGHGASVQTPAPAPALAPPSAAVSAVPSAPAPASGPAAVAAPAFVSAAARPAWAGAAGAASQNGPSAAAALAAAAAPPVRRVAVAVVKRARAAAADPDAEAQTQLPAPPAPPVPAAVPTAPTASVAVAPVPAAAAAATVAAAVSAVVGMFAAYGSDSDSDG
jgi:hypothetical protein